jgi:Zn finger protein HypA/HybF involved in hydrogenase expression
VHEVALVEELVGIVERSADGRVVERVRVRRATTIPDGVLEQAWTMLTTEGPLADAVLEVEPFDIRLACACGFDGPLGHDDIVPGALAVCPSCGALSALPPEPELSILEIRVATG